MRSSQRNVIRKRGTLWGHCNQSMALTPDQIYKLGAESLGWNNSTSAGKALIAEDMALLQRLQLAKAMGATGSFTHYLTSGQATAMAAARPLFIS